MTYSSTYGFTIYDVQYYKHDHETKILHLTIHRFGLNHMDEIEFTINNVRHIRQIDVEGEIGLEVYF